MLIYKENRIELKPLQKKVGAEEACRALADCYRRVIGEPKWRQYIELYRPDGTTAQLL